MTTLREAAQQALEALQSCSGVPHWPALQPTIDALRSALAQEQAEPVAWIQPRTVDGHLRPDLGYETCSSVDYGAFPVYRAPPKAEPVQEPVAWRYKPMIGSPWSLSDDGYYVSCKRDKSYIVEPLYTTLPRCPNCASLEAQNTELDRKLSEMEQADLSRCPQCNGPADNGHDRSIPPNPYLCTKCMAEPVAGIIESEIKGDSHQTLDDAMQQPRAMAQAYESGCKAGAAAERKRIIQFLTEMQRQVGDGHNHYGVAAMRIMERV